MHLCALCWKYVTGTQFEKFWLIFVGIFHFRFWYYGEWVDVVVDDYLPVHDSGTFGKKNLVYLQNSESSIGNEFWAALLEKAYAKLHGSYQKIDGGFTGDSMEDFSGGLSERYMLTKDSSPVETFNILKKAYEKGNNLLFKKKNYKYKVKLKTENKSVLVLWNIH